MRRMQAVTEGNKNAMKKLLIIILLISIMLSVNCFAAGGVITVGESAAKAGETVELTVSIKDNPGFCYLRVRPQYDENALELLSVKAGDVYADTVGMGLNIAIENGSDLHGDGSIAVLTFRVNEGAAPGSYAVNLKFIECYNYDELDVPVSITGGHIDVIGEGETQAPAPTTADDGTGKTSDNITGTDKTPVSTRQQTDNTKNGKGGTVIVAIIAAVICIAAAAAVALVLNKKKKK